MRNNRADFDYPNITGIVLREKYKTLFLCFICFTVLASCSPNKTEVLLKVLPVWNGQPIDCSSLPLSEQKWQIQKLAFFLSNMQLEVQDKIVPVKSNNQADVSLVRIEQQTCTAAFNLISDAPMTPGASLSFDLGVPFALNHLNPVTQPAPMNEPDMFWTWRNGYKFFRMDTRTEGESWAYHLGSVGCVSESAVRAPAAACAKTNLTRYKMKVPEGDAFVLHLHLDKLLEGITPNKANRCVMHGETEPACELLYDNVSDANKPLFTLEAR